MDWKPVYTAFLSRSVEDGVDGPSWAGRSLKIRRLVPTVPLQLSPALLVRLAGLQSGSKLERSGDREA